MPRLAAIAWFALVVSLAWAAPAGAARFPTAEQARQIFLTTGSSNTCRDVEDCSPLTPRIASADHRFVYLRHARAGFDQTRYVYRFTGTGYRVVVASRNGAGRCARARRVPRAVRREFRIRCHGSRHVEILGPKPARPSARMIVPFDGEALRVTFGHTTTLVEAVKLLGAATQTVTTVPVYGEVCVLEWPARLLRVTAYAKTGPHACAERDPISTVRISDRRFYTNRGLQVRTTLAGMRKLYPAAELVAGTTDTWLLEALHGPGEGEPFGVFAGSLRFDDPGAYLQAVVAHGRVTALLLVGPLPIV